MTSPATAAPHAAKAAARPATPDRRPLSVRSHGMTDRGRKRETNEDQFLVATLTKALQVRASSMPQPEVQLGDPQGHLFLVADGCGGHAAGEQASALAVRIIEEFAIFALTWCARLRPGPHGDALLGEFQKALTRANDRVCHEGERRPELRGMATTLTLAYFLGRDLFVAHVGDSRCYLLRNDLLYCLTRDHTLVAEMVRRGYVRPEDAAHHVYRHVVTNVVGGSDPGVEVEVHKLPLEAGDCLLLCSDGLTEMVPDGEILNVLAASRPDPAAACERLVKLANDKGGKDNVTAVVAMFDE